MNHSKLSIFLVAALGLSGFTSLGSTTPERARVIVLADMGNEPDEVQQMFDLLRCANEDEIEGLIAVTGKCPHLERKEPHWQNIARQLKC
jgi:hypothetical protein